jgi:hypothetical protein
MKELAEQVLMSNNIDWIPTSYVYNITTLRLGMYRLSFISGGSLDLSMLPTF